MAEPVDNLRYGMEDLAWAHHSQPTAEMALASIAVSLKRIADAMTGPDAGQAFATNIYHSISNALFEDFQRRN